MEGPLIVGSGAPADADTDALLARILRQTRTIAVVGASPDAHRPSHGVMAYLQRHGYGVFPVNPRAGVPSILGASVVAALDELPAPVDLVAVFRNSEAAFAAAEATISQRARLGIRTLWMQLGVRNNQAAQRATAAGLTVVMDRCLEIEHNRLLRCARN